MVPFTDSNLIATRDTLPATHLEMGEIYKVREDGTFTSVGIVETLLWCADPHVKQRFTKVLNLLKMYYPLSENAGDY